MSDGNGGVHVVFRGSGYFYNHLSAQGMWAYPLPGIALPSGSVVADGAGGVINYWTNPPNHPTHPSEVFGQRFDANGDSVWPTGGRQLLPSSYSFGMFHTLHPGRILVQAWLEQVPPFNQRLFLVDSNGTNLWEPQGRIFRPGEPSAGAILPDRTGGFFYHGAAVAGIWACHHYDAEAQLVGSTVPGNRNPMQADGLGGGYDYRMHGTAQDTVWSGWVWRWARDMDPAWPDSLLAWECNDCGSRTWTTADDGGVIGVIGSSTGFAFYRVNPEGTLGPHAAIDRPGVPVDRDFHILSVYPNPFNSTTQIEFTLPSTQWVSLRLYDVLGREVALLVNEIETAGAHRLTFDASGLPSGVYLCRLEAGEIMQTRKIVLIK